MLILNAQNYSNVLSLYGKPHRGKGWNFIQNHLIAHKFSATTYELHTLIRFIKGYGSIHNLVREKVTKPNRQAVRIFLAKHIAIGVAKHRGR